MFLGIDCGTQGTKALLIDEQGTPLGRGYARHALIEGRNGAREPSFGTTLRLPRRTKN
jgi:xylulokinase